MKTNGPQGGPTRHAANTYDENFPITMKTKINEFGAVEPLFFVDGQPVTPQAAMQVYGEVVGEQDSFNDFVSRTIANNPLPSAYNVGRASALLGRPGRPRGPQDRNSFYAQAERRTHGDVQSRQAGTENRAAAAARDSVSEQILKGLANWGRMPEY